MIIHVARRVHGNGRRANTDCPCIPARPRWNVTELDLVALLAARAVNTLPDNRVATARIDTAVESGICVARVAVVAPATATFDAGRQQRHNTCRIKFSSKRKRGAGSGKRRSKAS